MAKVDPYKLSPAFEHVITLATIRYPKFWGTLGHAIEPEALASKTAQLIFKAVRAVAKDLGNAPTDMRTVVQRVQRWVDDGNVTHEELNDVIDYFIDAINALPPEAEIIGELRPVLRRRLEADAVRAAMDSYAKRGDFTDVQRILSRAQSLGMHDTSTGLRLGSAAFDEIDRLRSIDRMGWGIEELDIGLDGGMPRGCLGVFAAPPGGGKSMALNHVVAHASRLGYFCCVATLEINRAAWMARLMSNLTGEPIAKIMASDIAETQRRIELMYPILGTVVVKDFPAKLTSMREITAWVDECAEEEGYRPHLLAVDYADKCKSHLVEDARRGEYDAQGTIYETMRLYVFDRGMWGFTASQPRRSAAKEKKRRIELDDLAESNKKAHVADLLVTGNRTPDGDMIEYYVAKNRYGKSDFSVGPLPHDWACGRMVPLVDP